MDSKEEVLENLRLADQYVTKAFPDVKKVNLVVIGGAALILKGFENKSTLDIDSVFRIEGQLSDFLRSFSINSDAADVSILPQGYENRLERLELGLSTLEVNIVSNEDLVISKVGRFDHDDKRDLETTGILDAIDTETLVELGEDLSKNNEKFKSNWTRFRKMTLFS